MQVEWTKLKLLNQENIDRINEVSGVYRISHYDKSKDSYIIHYVGQAKNLNERLNQHLPGNEVNTCCNKFLKNYNCYFRACAISAQSDRDGAEVALYEKYNPDCVEKIPDVEAIDINFE